LSRHGFWSETTLPLVFLVLLAGLGLSGCKGGSAPTRPTEPAPVLVQLSITSTLPTQELAEGATEAEVVAETNRDALCKGGKANALYDSLADTLTSVPTRVHRTVVRGLQPGATPYYVACITPDRSFSATAQINVQVSLPAVLARGSVVDLHSGLPVSGTLTINQKTFAIDPAGRYEVTRESGLSIGQRYSASILANGRVPRELVGTLTSGGLEVDLGGGRRESPLTVYAESATFRLSEYAAFCLRLNGALMRLEAPLKFAVFDSKIYRYGGEGTPAAGYLEVATRNMRSDSRESLLQTLRQDVPFWTSNQIYTPQNIESFIKLQSRGDELPDISRGSGHFPGWIVIVPVEGLDREKYLIARGDNGFINGGKITAGFLFFQPDITVQAINWTRDLRETFGIVQIRDTIRDERAPYLAVMFRRPVGHRAPDISR
jgi:hypothetical protein